MIKIIALAFYYYGCLFGKNILFAIIIEKEGVFMV